MENKLAWWFPSFCMTCPKYLQEGIHGRKVPARCSLLHAIYPKEAVEKQSKYFLENSVYELSFCNHCGIRPNVIYDEEKHPIIHCPVCGETQNAKGYGLTVHSELFLASALWNQKSFAKKWKERLYKEKNAEILERLFQGNHSSMQMPISVEEKDNSDYSEEDYGIYSEDIYTTTLLQKGLHDYESIQNLLVVLKDSLHNNKRESNHDTSIRQVYHALMESQIIFSSYLEFFQKGENSGRLAQHHFLIDYFQDRTLIFLQNYLFQSKKLPNRIILKYEKFFLELPRLYRSQYEEIMKPNFLDIESEIDVMERMMEEYIGKDTEKDKGKEAEKEKEKEKHIYMGVDLSSDEIPDISMMTNDEHEPEQMKKEDREDREDREEKERLEMEILTPRKRSIQTYDILSIQEKETLLDQFFKENGCSIRNGMDLD